MAANGDVFELKVVCYQTPDIQLALNVLHYTHQIQSGTGSSDTGIAVALDLIIAAVYKAALMNNAVYRGVSAQKIWPLPKGTPSFTTASNGPGVGGANGLPGVVTGLIRFNTNFAGRKFRGRIYPGFLPTAFSDANGTMNGAGSTAIANIRAAIPQTYLAGAVGNQSLMTHVIWHRGDHTTTPVTTYISSARFANQRRRSQTGRTNDIPF